MSEYPLKEPVAQSASAAARDAASAEFRYSVSGLAVLADVELPSAIPHAFVGEPDIVIRQAVLPPAEMSLPEDGTAVFRFRVPDVGRFLMRDGRELLYETAPGHDPGVLPLYLSGICFATLLQQRGGVVLHASAVNVGGRAMLFCGASGAGKSTLAAMLSDAGYPLLNDDVCSLTRDGAGRFVATPDGRMLKLWSASLEQLDQPRRGAEIIGRTDKFYTLPANSDRTARPVGGIYLLGQLPAGEPPSQQRLGPARAMAALQENAYRPELVRAMGQEREYFQATARLCATVPVQQLCRAKSFRETDAVLTMLAAAWQEGA